jgi:hypothetical protein
VVALTPELPATNRAFLEANQVSVDTTLSLSQSRIRLELTPAIIFVRKDGTVIGSWRGSLNGQKEREVLRVVEGG